MTKTIKICDEWGREMKWLYTFPLMKIKELNIEVSHYEHHEMCRQCAEEFLIKYNNYTDSQKEVSF